MVLQVNPIQKEPIVTWEALPADFILPDDPVENIQQPAIATALTALLYVRAACHRQTLRVA
ncbi:hypothetical protein LC609_16400 [Nostoc sp. XA013]|nr:hypothetical protein [Nostoc sp. XA013]